MIKTAFGARKKMGGEEMAAAKKCDRCGELYGVYNEGIFTMKSNGIAEINLKSNGYLTVNRKMDLCPECKRSFEKWRDNK